MCEGGAGKSSRTQKNLFFWKFWFEAKLAVRLAEVIHYNKTPKQAKSDHLKLHREKILATVEQRKANIIEKIPEVWKLSERPSGTTTTTAMYNRKVPSSVKKASTSNNLVEQIENPMAHLDRRWVEKQLGRTARRLNLNQDRKQCFNWCWKPVTLKVIYSNLFNLCLYDYKYIWKSVVTFLRKANENKCFSN